MLRAWRDDDLLPFAALNADPVVMEYFPATLSRAESDALATRIRAHFAQHGYGFWVLEIPGLTPFAGCVGLLHADFEAPFAPTVEIGWRLAQAYWGQGYATEAAQLALQYGFEKCQLPEIVSFTAAINLRSQALMRRLGMTHDCRDDFEHPKLPQGHRLRPHVLYRMIKPQ
ncbi:GNAT family N-acetyltransferase [Paraherbaspirillum soli]|uniref:GNAT family N-acetyltransferase n=1 Tax=Paraherbaspirillum soli TaxID=631222 RepID=A0ABW0M7F3_9BURK